MPSAKSRHVSGAVFSPCCSSCCVLFLPVLSPLSLFSLEGPVLGSEDAGRSAWPGQTPLCLGEPAEWSEGREDKQSQETSCQMNWNQTEGHHKTAAVTVTVRLAMYLPQREGLKEIACLSRLSRCLLWRMGCVSHPLKYSLLLAFRLHQSLDKTKCAIAFKIHPLSLLANSYYSISINCNSFIREMPGGFFFFLSSFRVFFLFFF